MLDVGRLHDTERLIFDHKPPAFPHRDLNCAASLVWKHLLSAGSRVGHLRELVELVHDGDAASRRGNSPAYRRSRTNGLHAVIAAARAYAQRDLMLYRGIAAYLEAVHLSDVNG